MTNTYNVKITGKIILLCLLIFILIDSKLEAKDSALAESKHSLSSFFSDFNINNLNAWRMDTFIFLKAIS